MTITFALKLTLVPMLMALITLAGRKWGPSVAGWLSAFPVVAGPILIFISQERGVEFTQTAAAGTFSAVFAIIVFGLSYAWAATQFTWFKSLIIAFCAYALAVTVLYFVADTLWMSTPLVLLALFFAPRLYPAVALPAQTMSSSRYDLMTRMFCAAVLVVIVTHFSTQLGPRLSGLFAMFPVLASLLSVFTHRQSGSTYVIHLLRGTVYGYYAFATFCLIVVLLLPRTSIAVSFIAAFVSAGIIQAFSRQWMQRHKTA